MFDFFFFFKFLQSAMASAGSSAASQPQRPNVNPLWRHSNPDSHYGFRQQPPSGSYRGRYHLPSSQTNPSDLSHYSAIPSGTGKKMSDVLIYSSINPQYSIPLLGRFTLIIHQNSISRTSTVHRLF